MAPSLVAFSSDVRVATVDAAAPPKLFFTLSDIRSIELVPALRWFLIVLVLSQVAAYHIRRSSERTKLRVHASVILTIATLHFVLVLGVVTYFYAVSYRLWTLWPMNPWFKALILLLAVLRSFAIQLFVLKRSSRRSLLNTLLLIATVGMWLASVCGSLGILVVVSASRAMEPSPVIKYLSRFSLTIGLACDLLITLMLYTQGDTLTHALSSLTFPKHTASSSKSNLFSEDYSLAWPEPSRRRSSVGSPRTLRADLEGYSDTERSELGHRRNSTAKF